MVEILMVPVVWFRVMSCKSSWYEPPLFSDTPCYADYAINLHSIAVFKYNTACVISRKPVSHLLIFSNVRPYFH